MKHLLRTPDVKRALGVGRATLYVHMDSGLLTKQVRVTGRAVGWPSDEIQAIVDARIAGATDAEIRALVERLHAARKATNPLAA